MKKDVYLTDRKRVIKYLNTNTHDYNVESLMTLLGPPLILKTNDIVTI